MDKEKPKIPIRRMTEEEYAKLIRDEYAGPYARHIEETPDEDLENLGKTYSRAVSEAELAKIRVAIEEDGRKGI